jgi:hypothetical protein
MNIFELKVTYKLIQFRKDLMNKVFKRIYIQNFAKLERREFFGNTTLIRVKNSILNSVRIKYE